MQVQNLPQLSLCNKYTVLCMGGTVAPWAEYRLNCVNSFEYKIHVPQGFSH